MRNKMILAAIVGLLLIAFITAVFIPTSDENNWIAAGVYFKEAVINLQPDKTYVPEVSHRLGVTVLWVSSVIYMIFGFLPTNYLIVIHRFVFLIINLLLFGGALTILRKFVSEKVFLLFIFYILANRFFSIIGRSTWLDQLLTLLSFLSILIWMKYLSQKKTSYLVLSAIFNGLMMLTKYAGWYFPLIIILLTFIYSHKNKKKFSEYILPLVKFLGISLFVFILFYPVMWVDPKKALLLRFGDRTSPVKRIVDIWDYFREFKLIEPVLIFGSIFVILDWLKGKRDFLFFLCVGGLLYLGIYILTFVILIITGRINHAFLEGIYRYTFPALPMLSVYTFYRYKSYISNKKLQLAFILILFLREIAFSPFWLL